MRVGGRNGGKTRPGTRITSNSPDSKSLLSQEGTPFAPHLPDVVQELGGREAVLRAGELAAVVLEEGQQVRLQVKQPVGGGLVSALGCCPAGSTSPGCPAAGEGGTALAVNYSTPFNLARTPLPGLPVPLSHLLCILEGASWKKRRVPRPLLEPGIE